MTHDSYENKKYEKVCSTLDVFPANSPKLYIMLKKTHLVHIEPAHISINMPGNRLINIKHILISKKYLGKKPAHLKNLKINKLG